MIISGDKPKGSGDIEDIVRLSKNRYPGNLEMQAKYIQVAIDLIKRDGGDEVKSGQISWKSFNVDLTMFASGGLVYTFWKLVKYGDTYAAGLEKMNPNTDVVTMLFYSNPEYSEPMLHLWMR